VSKPISLAVIHDPQITCDGLARHRLKLFRGGAEENRCHFLLRLIDQVVRVRTIKFYQAEYSNCDAILFSTDAVTSMRAFSPEGDCGRILIASSVASCSYSKLTDASGMQIGQNPKSCLQLLQQTCHHGSP